MSIKHGKASLISALTILLFLFTGASNLICREIVKTRYALKGFSTAPFLAEQVLSLEFSPDVNVEINAPSAEKFDKTKKVSLIFYALPNSNTIEQTIGREKHEGLDWHFDIQHIGAQTRFIREHVNDRNIVVVYLGTKEESWIWWRSKHPDGDYIIKHIVDSVKYIFKDFTTEVVLDGHSGGGTFVFGYISSLNEIPSYVKRISFLDSEYDYSSDFNHRNKIVNWLKAEHDHYLCIIAYDDKDIKINGKDIGAINGGTYYQSGLIADDLGKAFYLYKSIDTVFTKYYGLNGRIKIFLKSNPEHQMWHTLLVEKNGFIESILSGTPYEEKDYQFWGWRAYSQYIQP